MKTTKLSWNISTLMAIVTLISFLEPTTVFATEDQIVSYTSETTNAIEPRAGTETLPLGWYTISSRFNITGHNTTPVKTVRGRYLKLNYTITKPVTSEPIAIIVEVKDYNTGIKLGSSDVFFMNENSGTAKWETIEPYDLGYAGRKVQIYTRIDLGNSHKELSQAVTFTNYKSYVYN